MTIHNTLALVLGLAAGIAGVLIGRTTASRDAPQVQVEAPHPPSTTPLTGRECKVERAELTSAKAQLAICRAYTPQPSEAHAPTPIDEEAEADAVREQRNREVLRTHTEVVIVRRADGTTSIYPPDEPIPDGIIVARRLPSGEIGWYAGPDAGARSDPAAFLPHYPRQLVPPDPNAGEPALERMFDAGDPEYGRP